MDFLGKRNFRDGVRQVEVAAFFGREIFRVFLVKIAAFFWEGNFKNSDPSEGRYLSLGGKF